MTEREHQEAYCDTWREPDGYLLCCNCKRYSYCWLRGDSEECEYCDFFQAGAEWD